PASAPRGPGSGARAGGRPAVAPRSGARMAGPRGGGSVGVLLLLRVVAGRGLRQLPLVFRHHLLRQVLTGGVVDRVSEVLVLAVRPLATGHRHKQSTVAADDLEPSNHERIIQRDAREGLELVVVPQRYTNLGDLDHEMYTSEPSLRFSWLVCGALPRRRPWVERPRECPSVASTRTRGRGVGARGPRSAPRTAARS